MQVATIKNYLAFLLPVLINKSGSGIFLVCKFLLIFFSLMIFLFFLILLKALINSDFDP